MKIFLKCMFVFIMVMFCSLFLEKNNILVPTAKCCEKCERLCLEIDEKIAAQTDLGTNFIKEVLFVHSDCKHEFKFKTHKFLMTVEFKKSNENGVIFNISFVGNHKVRNGYCIERSFLWIALKSIRDILIDLYGNFEITDFSSGYANRIPMGYSENSRFCKDVLLGFYN